MSRYTGENRVACSGSERFLDGHRLQSARRMKPNSFSASSITSSRQARKILLTEIVAMSSRTRSGSQYMRPARAARRTSFRASAAHSVRSTHHMASRSSAISRREKYATTRGVSIRVPYGIS